MRWYVVHTYSGRENKVRETVERMIRNSGMENLFGKVLVATEEVAEMKKGKKKVSQRKLFPSYILIEMEMTDEGWAMIENVPGVTHFVGEGKKTTPHEVSLLDLLAIAHLSDSLPRNRALIAIQPQCMDWSEALSDAVEQSLSLVCDQTLALIRRWQC